MLALYKSNDSQIGSDYSRLLILPYCLYRLQSSTASFKRSPAQSYSRAVLLIAMANHPRSFRRNLLLRILAFSLPILFIGQAVALRKARTSLLTTARQNLTSSAIRKAEELETGIQSVKANLDLLAETEAFQSGDVDAIEQILTEFIQDVTPYTINCVELK
ncbi:MAG: hypothetical protein AAFP07_20765, partial [Cyanobacteria bacterium J06606_4]